MDIVLDNSGLELFTDLCLADFLLASGAADGGGGGGCTLNTHG